MSSSVRRRLSDAPHCADWNADIRAARDAHDAEPTTRWCEWPESEEPCWNLAARWKPFCNSHMGTLAVRRKEEQRAS